MSDTTTPIEKQWDEGTKPILCLDFDGVIHSYESGWKGADVIPDPPVPGALDFIKDAQNVGFVVAIFSSRSGQEGGIAAMKEWLVNAAVAHYGMAPFWLDEIQWPTEKPPAFVTLDDRALTFEGDWPKPKSLRDFKPWNKR
jgi:hypothetical protein